MTKNTPKITRFFMVHTGDSLSYHDGQFFSTLDQDNDSYIRHCARDLRNGGWWYFSCDYCNLNGLYLRSSSNPKGITWDTWLGSTYSLKFTQMMIRPWDYQQ